MDSSLLVLILIFIIIILVAIFVFAYEKGFFSNIPSGGEQPPLPPGFEQPAGGEEHHPCRGGGERRGQVHPDEGPVRHAAAPGRRDPLQGARGAPAQLQRGHPPGNRHGPSAPDARPGDVRG